MIQCQDFTSSALPVGSLLSATPANDDPVFQVQPRLLGLGCDRLIGGASGPRYKVIDLSLLSEPVEIHWSGPDCGSITDGADTIVFQGVDRIILPECMKPCYAFDTAA